VVLPVDEYRSLREKALLPAASPVSPVEATLTRIDYSLRAENDVIVGQARKFRADLIVMGTHGRRGVRRMVLGSAAEGVVRESPVPVLLIRAR